MSDLFAPLSPAHAGVAMQRAWSAACVLAEGPATEERKRQNLKTQRSLVLALTVALLFMGVELVGGLYAHSLAIITDAAHLLTDVSGFAVSLAVAYYASAPTGRGANGSRQHFSYGYHRLEVLGALASVASVWLVTGVLLWEAVQRVRNPEPVNGKLMFILAVVGVGVNVVLLAILGGHHGHSHSGSHSHSDHSHSGHSHSGQHDERGRCEDAPEAGDRSLAAVEEGLLLARHAAEGPEPTSGAPAASRAGGDDAPHALEHANGACGERRNINVRGAVVHAIGDLVQSLGVAVAGAVIWWHQGDARWALADPLCTFLFAGLVLWTTTGVLGEIADVLMERTPRGLSVDTVTAEIHKIRGVSDVHDLHMWSLTPGIPLLAVHVTLLPDADPAAVLHAVTRYCRGLGIDHTTIQLVLEGGACPCGVSGGDGGESESGCSAGQGRALDARM